MSKIDQLLADAREAAKNAEGEEKARQQGRAEALLEMKGEGYTKTDTEVGGIVKRNREEAETGAEKWTELFGMTMEEVEVAVQELESATDGLEDDQAGEGESGSGSILERMRSALSQRDSKIQASEEYTQGLARDLYSERVENRLKEALKAKGIKENRVDIARRVSDEKELVEKLMKGESLEPDVFTKRAERIYEDSSEWFKSEESEDGDELIVAGHKIKEEAIRPHIPATPTAKETAEITDADRATRATSVY